MRKIFLLILCLFLVGCGNNKNSNDDSLAQDEINLEYKNMESKLIEYGTLIYENDKWLNDNSEPVMSYVSLSELSSKYGYDISMFINPETGKQCDLEESKIEFTIVDSSDKNNIIYEFNPVLVCCEKDKNNDNEYNDDDVIILDEQPENVELNIKLASYIYDLYNKDYFSGGKNKYKITLSELSREGYDISMFVNSDTGKQCDLDKTYGEIYIDKINNDEDDYNVNTYINCN